VTNVVHIDRGGERRAAGPAEREKLAQLFEAIGDAANATTREMPEFSAQDRRRQMTQSFAGVGSLVMYADLLRHGATNAAPDTLDAVIQLGRELSARIEVKPS
jgi:hypothetical protein